MLPTIFIITAILLWYQATSKDAFERRSMKPAALHLPPKLEVVIILKSPFIHSSLDVY